jgi:hypothetical protein
MVFLKDFKVINWFNKIFKVVFLVVFGLKMVFLVTKLQYYFLATAVTARYNQMIYFLTFFLQIKNIKVQVKGKGQSSSTWPLYIYNFFFYDLILERLGFNLIR